jgi:TolB-like protein
MQFHFGNHVLDVGRRELRHGSEPIAVEPQVFDLLLYLLQNRDRVASKDDLIASIWGGRIVSASTLTSRIKSARNAVGDSGRDQKLIRTIARKGFRFVGAVSIQEDGAEPAFGNRKPPYIHEQSRPALSPPDRPTIAVLPFVNMSGDPDQAYFSDGISEDIITALSKLRWFFVIARNSSFIFKGRAVHMKQVAEELGVGYVVEGSVRKDGDRVRITTQLSDAATGTQIWAERYDRDLVDVFAVQDEITEAIVAAIEPQLYAAENFRANRKPPDNMDAWDLVMRALWPGAGERMPCLWKLRNRGTRSTSRHRRHRTRSVGRDESDRGRSGRAPRHADPQGRAREPGHDRRNGLRRTRPCERRRTRPCERCRTRPCERCPCVRQRTRRPYERHHRTPRRVHPHHRVHRHLPRRAQTRQRSVPR